MSEDHMNICSQSPTHSDTKNSPNAQLAVTTESTTKVTGFDQCGSIKSPVPHRNMLQHCTRLMISNQDVDKIKAKGTFSKAVYQMKPRPVLN